MFLKILVVTLSLSRNAGGLFYSVRELSKELSKELDTQIEVVGVKDEFYEEDKPAWQGINVKAFKRSGILTKFGVSWELAKHIFNSNADIIHLHGIWNFASFAVLLRVLYKPTKLVISPSGMLDKWIINKGRVKKKIYWNLLEKRLFARANTIHALNNSEYDSVKSILPQAKVDIFPNGIHKLPKLSAEHNSKKLIFISRIDPKKGVKELVEAWEAIPDHKGWSLEIYGWGDESYIQSIKNNISTNSTTSFLGSVYGKEKDKVLRSANAFILPSYSEGLPMAVLEAWSYELPVLMTQECNLPIGYSSNSAIEIKLNTLKEDLTCLFEMSNEDLKTIGKSAVNLVSEKYLWSSIASQMILMFREMK